MDQIQTLYACGNKMSFLYFDIYHDIVRALINERISQAHKA